MYFNNCKSLDEAKNLFRELCKKLHPDTSGYDSEKDFVKMYAEFKKIKNNTFDSSKCSDSEKEFNANFDAEKFYNLIKLFDGLENIKISFVGCFIWLEDIVKNATFQQKENIKLIKIEGYNPARFASTKKVWYFSPVDYVQKSKGTHDLEEIKKKYGNNSFVTKSNLKLAS